MTAALDRRATEVLPSGPRLVAHDAAVFALREKRDHAGKSEPDFERLREYARVAKAHALDHLDSQLERFEARAAAAGAVVHWAEDAAELNRIVHGLLDARGARHVVKSKSMLTEECGLNPYLESRGIEVVDTDLGERIVQLGHEPPSHIIMPAIHRTREDIGALFARELDVQAGETDPARLTEAARRHLRGHFLGADAAITGVNFAIAETGTVVVVTNEGNADLGMSLPKLHIACLGIEKVIPGLADLAVFLRLLARSATGQPISVYTSLVTGPRPGAELHIVLVDNGRTRLLADERHRRALGCIRCGACLNTCPVYRRAGGHSYGFAIPGPIGAVLAPALSGKAEHRALPLASTLCGSCTAVCPVKIDLHEQLISWRSTHVPRGPRERVLARVAAAVLARPALYRLAGRAARLAWPVLSRRWPGNPATAWLEARALPEHPGASVRARWRARERGAVRCARERASSRAFARPLATRRSRLMPSCPARGVRTSRRSRKCSSQPAAKRTARSQSRSSRRASPICVGRGAVERACSRRTPRSPVSAPARGNRFPKRRIRTRSPTCRSRSSAARSASPRTVPSAWMAERRIRARCPCFASA